MKPAAIPSDFTSESSIIIAGSKKISPNVQGVPRPKKLIPLGRCDQLIQFCSLKFQTSSVTATGNARRLEPIINSAISAATGDGFNGGTGLSGKED